MRLFIGERRMAPAAFWSLTIPEIEAVLTAGARRDSTSRADFERLMERFPDG
jgi:uncharacterized phage protein (TIGR02216 family)